MHIYPLKENGGERGLKSTTLCINWNEDEFVSGQVTSGVTTSSIGDGSRRVYVIGHMDKRYDVTNV